VVLYGDVTEPADENTPSAPISPYGISKWAGEQYLQFFVREHGITGVAMRYNVYGRGRIRTAKPASPPFLQKMLVGGPRR
jgi:UDP-glucose 4-epimerase